MNHPGVSSKALICAVILALCATITTRAQAGANSVVYEPAGTANGKHIVFLSGDEEYRSEEGLPMLAKILSQRHGFKCTVLFAIDPDGTINPKNLSNLPDAQALDSADEIVMLLRFRAWPDDQMKHFADAVARGVPVIGLRTATHAFAFKDGTYTSFNGFGKRVLGEHWVNHWGSHKKEATRAIIEAANKDNPLLSGVSDIFVTSDVYEAYPPADATILLRGQVVKGMTPADPAADYKKQRSTDHKEQGVNDPMMPIAWSRIVKNDSGKENRAFCTTMGAATDLQSEDLRRLIVNAAYWGLGMSIPAKADVTYVGDYKPSDFGFDGFRKGMKPADFALPASAPAPGASAPAPTAIKLVMSVSAPEAPEHPLGSPFLQLRPDDHIAIIGNTLADRFQFDGYLETMIYASHPQDHLVFRNLAVSGDEVVKRARSLDFGTPDEWLTKVKADVILAFFGFNESFHGPAGLSQFKADLNNYLKATLAKNYSGKGSPRIVLFSPIANERLTDPNYPDTAANNANIKLYADAMREVAAASHVQFVDLFEPSQKLFAQGATAKKPLTINEIHLSEDGDKAIAPIIYQSVFGIDPPTGDFEKLRTTINDKNWEWHKRYRTVDGYNVYGGRSHEEYESPKGGPKISNNLIMQQEMTRRDAMTFNRDRQVWAVAQGHDLQLETDNLPPVQQIKTNDPGPNPDGTWVWPTGEGAIAKMTVAPHCKVNLFASEEQFPELVNPVQMAWDTKGRLWVSAWRNYPERTPDSKVGDSILIFEDTKGTGHADKCTHFIDDLNCPTGFQFYKDGILLMQAPDLWFVRDTTGGDHANWKQRILMGMDSADSHHTTNSMVLDPGGGTYLSDGVFHRTQVETFLGPVRNEDACIYRFEPSTGRFERYAPYGYANPHGRVFDYWGNDLISDATGNNTYFGPAISGHLDYPAKHETIQQFWDRPSRPCPGTAIITTPQFPDEFQGNFLNCNVIGFQGIYRVRVDEVGSGLKGTTLDPLISSPDPTFRPSGVNVGPDGALYITDWSQALIGHLQHHLRDPNRQHQHGRIYRMVYEGRPLMTPVKIDGQPIPALLELLKRPENQIRTLAKIELAKHDTAEVIAAVDQWAGGLNKSDAAYEHEMTEALWVHQWLNVVDDKLLTHMLQSPDPHARTAATRVLCYWRDRVPEALSLLKTQAEDQNPRVRLEAVRAASFFSTPAAVDVALTIVKHPTDYYLDYVLNETMRQLHPIWQHALDNGEPIASDNAAGTAYLLKTTRTEDLLKLPPSPATLQAIFIRSDAPDASRMSALAGLASEQKISGPAVLLNMVDEQEKAREGSSTSIVRFLNLQPPDALKGVRDRLLQLATASHVAMLRETAWAAIATADQSFDGVWKDAAKSPTGEADLLNGIPLVFDSELRATAEGRVIPLLAPDAKESDDSRGGAIHAAASMPHQQKDIFAAFVALIDRGIAVPDASRGISGLQRRAWNNADAGNASIAIVKWAQSLPKERRTDQDYVETVQFATELAGLLPPDKAADVRTQLKGLKVAVFVVNTLREQMKYDTTRLVVEAGKPFEIIFQNNDFMPHNIAIVKPGARPALGAQSNKMRPDELDTQGRAFMPKSRNIIGATKLVEPGQKEVLNLIAPKIEGIYEYFCTYPGHWDRMWGRLIVTKDVDAYLAAHPNADPLQ
jgi:glucose/arabinose dehydrogenase/azurin/type 1 glutamine amidotransferase/lysophospholipase L1-like esterase